MVGYIYGGLLWWDIFMVGCFHKLLLPRFSVKSIAFNFFQKKKIIRI